MKFIPSIITVPVAVAGAAVDWVASFVAENTASVRMELNQKNLENILKAVEAEAKTRASVAGAKAAKPKGKASPKKSRGLPTPWGSPNHRRLYFKDRGEVLLKKGVKDPTHFRTPRKYSVTSTKRRAGGSKRPSAVNHRRGVSAVAEEEPRKEVFGSDGEMTDFDE